jgi:hypothetical protein
MKIRTAVRIVRIGLFLFLLMVAAQAISQERERIHRFGIRGSYKIDDVDLWGAEASYQIYLKGMRRLEIGVGGMSSSAWDIFQVTALYQWCFLELGGFTMYAGPGAGFGFASYGYGESEFYGVLAADIGMDYTFRLPFQIAVDYRPEYSAWQEVGAELTNQIALAVRFAF